MYYIDRRLFTVSKLFPGKRLKKLPSADVKAAPDVYRWKDCIAKYQPNPPKVKLTFNDIAMYQYTGGTTGVSKGVIDPCQFKQASAAISAWFPTFGNGKEIMLGALPYFHVFGISCSMNLPFTGLVTSACSQTAAGAAVGGDSDIQTYLHAVGAHDVYRHAEPSRPEKNGYELYQRRFFRQRATAVEVIMNSKNNRSVISKVSA